MELSTATIIQPQALLSAIQKIARQHPQKNNHYTSATNLGWDRSLIIKSSTGQEKARVMNFKSNFPDSIANPLLCEKEQNLRRRPQDGCQCDLSAHCPISPCTWTHHAEWAVPCLGVTFTAVRLPHLLTLNFFVCGILLLRRKADKYLASVLWLGFKSYKGNDWTLSVPGRGQINKFPFPYAHL